MLARSRAALDGRPLVVRTLDAGAESRCPSWPGRRGQPVPRLRRIASRSPGRALPHPAAAILRVAAEHPLAVMFPMVATLEEVRAARARSTPRGRSWAAAPRWRSASWSRSGVALAAAEFARRGGFLSSGRTT